MKRNGKKSSRCSWLDSAVAGSPELGRGEGEGISPCWRFFPPRGTLPPRVGEGGS